MATVDKFSRMGEELLVYGGNSSQTATTMQQMQDYMVLEANTVGNLTDCLLWQPKTNYTKGAIVHSPNIPAGYVAECKSTSGQTGSNEPAWSTDYLEFTDGTITWRMTRAAGGDGVPIGSIVPFSGNGNLPNGYLLCNGASVLRTMYPDLFTAIGTTYGATDDTHFNLPDLVDRFIEGSDESGEIKQAGLPNITGSFGDYRWTTPTGAFARKGAAGSGVAEGSYGFDNVTFDASRSSAIYGNSTTVQPPALCLRYIIKAFDGQTADSSLIDVTQYAQELANKANKDLSNLSQAGKDSFLNRDFTIIYPNNGTADAPANVTINSSYIMPNPFSGYEVQGCAEVYINGTWYPCFNVDMTYYSSGQSSGISVCSYNNQIIVKTGVTYLFTSSLNAGPVAGGGLNPTTAPCRVKVWKVGKIS